MKDIIFASFCSLFLLTSIQAQTIDSKNSYISFEVKNLGKTVEGTISNMEGTIQLDPSNLTVAKLEATVDPSTVNTGTKARDKHLQKDEYFGVEKYGTIKMVSKEVKKTATGYEAVALLTIRDVETEVVVPFTVKEQDGRQILEGNFEVKRKDYNLGTSIGKMLIGLEVQVTIHAEVLP